MAKLLNPNDTINGKEGRAIINLKGKVYDLFYIKKAEAKFTKTKSQIKTVGRRNTGNKTVGWEGTGTLTLYYVTSLFRKLCVEYIKTGKDFTFDLVIENEDPTSATGKQATALYGCNIDEVILASLDVDSDGLEEEIPFTFEDADILTQFDEL